MTTFYVSPLGTANGSGASWASATSLDKMSTLLAKAQPGDTILLRADQGAYTIANSLNLFNGGTADQPITIKGVDGAGNDMNASFTGSRAEVYAPSNAQGAEVFRLMNGASHLAFENMAFTNVATAFRLAANAEDITIKDMAATNVSRFVDNMVSGAGTATVKGLAIENVAVDGFAKGVVRLQYDTNDVTINNVQGDSRFIDGASFAMGIHLDGTAHDVTISNTAIGNILDTTTAYHNGDAFTTEKGVYDVHFINTYAYNNSDGGYDLKSKSTTLEHAVAEGNTRNFRFWSDDTVATNIIGIDPKDHGGYSTVSNVWLGGAAKATIKDSTFYQADKSTLTLDLTYRDAALVLDNVKSSNMTTTLYRLSATSSLSGTVLPAIDAPGGWSAAMPTTGGAALFTPVAGATAGNDKLTGTDGNDLLDGLAGADRMSGGKGNDIYVVDHANDRVIELTGQGDDLVRTMLASYRLGDNIENLTYTGTANFTGIGNGLANVITGGIGNDRLDGGAGADRLVGGAGNDTYVVDHVNDVVVELAGQGSDTVLTTLTGYTLGSNVENVTYNGIAAFTGTGNALANVITGGAGADVIEGLAGNDTLSGLAGKDVLNGGDGNDLIDGGGNEDVLHGNAGDDRIIGGNHGDQIFGDDGNDTIIGDSETIATGSGFGAVDRIEGGAGNDTIFGDAVTLGLAGANDQIKGGAGDDVIYGDAMTITGAGTGGADTIDGGDGNDWIYGDAKTGGAGKAGGADRITGGAGDDHIFGGGGNDMFVFASGFGKDVIHDFGQTAGDDDRIDFDIAGLKFSDLAISYAGGNAVIETPSHDTITLIGITSLTASDFVF